MVYFPSPPKLDMGITDDPQRDLLEHVLVPVAHADDALKTAKALAPYNPEQVTVTHVVEKAGGAPDKTPVEQSEEIAAESYDTFREVFPDADIHVTYGRDVVGAILEAATEVDATAVAYQSRGGNRITHFLSGDLSLKLVTRSDRPVIALPRKESE